MKWHDALAERASSLGRSAAEFRAAARRKVATAWIFLAVTILVWQFGGWAWAMVPLALVAWNAFQFASATEIARRMEAAEAQAASAPNVARDVTPHATSDAASGAMPGAPSDATSATTPDAMSDGGGASPSLAARDASHR